MRDWGVAYDSNCTVPRARAECVFGHEVPVHGEDFSHVLFPRLDGEFVNANVEELDGAIASGDEDLVLMRFGPGEVEESVLRVEPWPSVSFDAEGGRGLLGQSDEGESGAHTISQQ